MIIFMTDWRSRNHDALSVVNTRFYVLLSPAHRTVQTSQLPMYPPAGNAFWMKHMGALQLSARPAFLNKAQANRAQYRSACLYDRKARVNCRRIDRFLPLFARRQHFACRYHSASRLHFAIPQATPSTPLHSSHENKEQK
eukprot:gnl/TRDRNA2_/TRDRNA2_169468_c0_seq3.p2 gnl/TRDRNA2_/TRDRNA2_169468_c0~~gnl/TRDRNA2_/TRDRNA2_169468_c0_seq3.p2  ORF type:complete len:140 (-),score=8.02 gnl/TRDRNA2_/TRDRNA2_169468_c0_seq3:140-559(-)